MKLHVPVSCDSTAFLFNGKNPAAQKLAMMLLIDMPFNHAELKMLETLIVPIHDFSWVVGAESMALLSPLSLEGSKGTVVKRLKYVCCVGRQAKHDHSFSRSCLCQIWLVMGRVTIQEEEEWAAGWWCMVFEPLLK